MLHRAASNAFSWWWASHIRTKQSKWLEQHLQDMDEKVQYVLKLIQEDGDSFAKRAEMYYKARPELINFVEESYKSYRALAERYDKISTDLQKANNTIASVFPEQVQLMEEDDEDSTPRYRREFKSNPPPQAPTAPGKRDIKGMLTLATKKLQQKKMKPAPPKSGLTKAEALKEIDRLQKGILALQTEKEFIKSSYELGLSRYWEIEKEITEMQEKNESLQDEFDASLAIEDEDARNLMATTALQSCQRTLDNLQKAQEETVEEVRVESQKVTEAREKLESFNVNQEKPCENKKSKAPQERLECLDQAVGDSTQEEGQELGLSAVGKQSEAGLNSSLTMTEMAEKIDELVNKVVSLQTVVSSQTALVKRLRTETDELHTKIQGLEGDKETLTGTVKNLGTDLRELEKQMHEKHDPNQNVESQNNHLQTHFTEALRNLDQLYDMLGSDKEDRELVVNKQEDAPNPSDEKEISLVEAESQKEPEEQDKPMLKNAFLEDKKVTTGEGGEEEDNQSEAKKYALLIGDNPFKALREQEDEPNWKQLFLDGMTDKEKTLLCEFTAMLKDYKEIKQKLGEVENKRVVQVKELEDVNAKKDADIQSLQKKLNHLRLHLVGETASRRSRDSDHQDASTLPDHQNAEPQAGTNEDRTSTVAPKPTEKEVNDEEDAKIILIDQAQPMSATEEKLRANIDTLLEENLDFWLRFSTSVHQIQKFQTEVEDLQTEVSTLKEKAKKKHDTSGSVDSSVKSEVRPIYKHLKEKQTELSVWLEQNALLKEELQKRFSSLCNIREDITRTLKEGSGDEEIKFTSHQAAKLQGEVMNMQQENNKVAGELQAGLDHVVELQSEVEKTLSKLNEEFGIAGSKSSNQAQLTHSTSRGRVPLQSFIFGVKQKKQKSSIFSCMNPSHRKYSNMKSLPM